MNQIAVHCSFAVMSTAFSTEAYLYILFLTMCLYGYCTFKASYQSYEYCKSHFKPTSFCCASLYCELQKMHFFSCKLIVAALC